MNDLKQTQRFLAKLNIPYTEDEDFDEKYHLGAGTIPAEIVRPIRALWIAENGYDSGIGFLFDVAGQFIGTLGTDCSNFQPVFEARQKEVLST